MFLQKVIKTGEVLITEGTIQPFIFILKSGRMTVLKSKGRDVKILGEIYPGEFIGEMAHLGTQKMHQASVIAVVDSEVIEIPSDDFVNVLASNPIWLKALLRSLVSRVESQNKNKIS